MEHATQDHLECEAPAVLLLEDMLVEVLSHPGADSMCLSPETRTCVQRERRLDLDQLYPGVLQGDEDAIRQLCENPEAVESFAVLPESKPYVDLIAAIAASHGNMPLLGRMVARGAGDFDWIAVSAACGGHFKIVQWAVKQGANDFSGIAVSAACMGQFLIVQWAVKQGANNFDWIARRATEGGYPEITQWVQNYQRTH